MAEVERLLIDANIEYRRAPQQIDSLTIAPALTNEIIRISSSSNGEPFMYADQPPGAPAPVIYVNNVTGSKSQPFTGEKAINYAIAVLSRQEVQKRLAAELKKWQAEYKPKIIYAKGYGAPDFSKFQKPAAAGAATGPATGAAASPAAPASPSLVSPSPTPAPAAK